MSRVQMAEVGVMPSLINTAMLMAAGSLAGFVNAIAGGGTAK